MLVCEVVEGDVDGYEVVVFGRRSGGFFTLIMTGPV